MEKKDRSSNAEVRWQQSQQQVGSAVADEFVLMGLASSKYYGLKDSASVIWPLLKAPVTLEEIVNHLLEHYDVAPDVCRNDVSKFLHQLEDESLIRRI